MFIAMGVDSGRFFQRYPACNDQAVSGFGVRVPTTLVRVQKANAYCEGLVSDQNTNLAASCMMRGASATVIWPNCGLFRCVTDVPPSNPPTQPMQERKLLVRLKASPRIS